MKSLHWIALAAALAAAPVLAAEVADGTQLGKTEAEIAASLTDLGFDVRKFKMKGDLIEAYAVKDGVMLEVFVDPATGAVAMTKVKG